MTQTSLNIRKLAPGTIRAVKAIAFHRHETIRDTVTRLIHAELSRYPDLVRAKEHAAILDKRLRFLGCPR